MKKMKIGIIGAGRIAHVHARSLSYFIPGAEVAAICDPFMSDQSREWIAEMGISKVLDDHKALLADPEIDAVLVCSSTDTHAAMTREAAKAGKHVFCEKPIDLDPEEIRETLRVVKEADVKLQVGFNRRFDHNFRALKDAALEGRLGKLEMIRVISRDPSPPPIEYVKVSGGLFMDMMIHDFDMVRFLSGAEVTELSATAAVLVDQEIGRAGDVDTAIVTMKLSNGALALIDNSRRAAYGYDQRAEVFGSRGSAFSANDCPSTAVISDDAGVHTEKPFHFFLERYQQAFTSEMQAFIDAVQKGEEPLVGGDDGLAPVLIALAAKESLETGKVVKLSW